MSLLQPEGCVHVTPIDRFKGDQAIIEYDGRTFTMPPDLAAKNAREGDVLKLIVEVDTATTTGRRTRVKSLEDRPFKR